ncbi:ATP-dependent nuclease [Bacillus toyonensis]|uniref:ATP-dependent nuclease n=1 Tax=Bacillus toyonensis TaxID=155322 RepID=UPI0019052E86|nr:AAA family ATPase [Bacillus toyonensis]QQN85420.1 AAA family ATPase [Bacillus toyonensis]
MFLKEIKIWNFRKFGEEESCKPGLQLQLHKNFNLLIGENDAGKSAIIDAIHFALGTISSENLRITDEDFFVNDQGKSSNEMKIECVFADLNDQEAGLFLEWLSFNQSNEYELIVRLTAKKVNNELTGDRIEKVIKAGPINADFRLEGTAKEVIKATYLKPLRDAKNELKPGFKSRLAQILKGYSSFKVNTGSRHSLEDIVESTNQKVEEYFTTPTGGKTIIGEISNYLEEFFNIPVDGKTVHNPKFQVAPAKLNDILRKLSLDLDDKVSGLGSLNLLFIAAEMLLLNDRMEIGPNLTLIEEIEAHLHPQAQLRLIKYLQKRLEGDLENKGQFILSTHSTTLAASTSLEHIILIHDNKAYPMGYSNTSLEQYDYEFLERFLDATKANLFFAKGVIFVEGDAENLLLPMLSELIDRPLHRYGVSIVNIGNTAFKRYAKIFSRSKRWLEMGNPTLNMPVSIVTDVDIRPIEYYQDSTKDNKAIFVISDKSQLEGIIGEDILDEDINEIIGKTFTSLSKLKGALDKYSITIKKEHNDKLREAFATNIDEETIEELKGKRKLQIESEFQDLESNLGIFVAPNWTLEYELALSSLGPTLAKVVHSIRYKCPESARNKKTLDDIVCKLESVDEKAKAAYEVYKPLNNKYISKAIVAQQLAKKLEEIPEELKTKVAVDPYLSYLVKAIYHVTEPPEGGEE